MPDAAQLARVLEEVGRSFLNFRTVANREAELLSELAAHHELTVTVPQFFQRDHRSRRSHRNR